jgi:hypothetical protein
MQPAGHRGRRCESFTPFLRSTGVDDTGAPRDLHVGRGLLSVEAPGQGAGVFAEATKAAQHEVIATPATSRARLLTPASASIGAQDNIGKFTQEASACAPCAAASHERAPRSPKRHDAGTYAVSMGCPRSIGRRLGVGILKMNFSS